MRGLREIVDLSVAMSDGFPMGDDRRFDHVSALFAESTGRISGDVGFLVIVGNSIGRINDAGQILRSEADDKLMFRRAA